jgi:hypothetical protein
MLFNPASYFQTSTIETSTMNAYSLLPQSSIQVGSFYIWGNASAIEYNQGTNCLQTAPESNLLVLNDMKIIGEGTATGPITRRVAINEDLMGSDFTATLGVNNTIAAGAITTNAFLSIDTYGAQGVVVSTMYGYGGSTIELYSGYGSIYLSSGVISTTRGKFFLNEDESYDERFNTVQPYRSTLQFNSTLFVNREISSVGINTQPNFTLDVPNVLTGGITYVGPSSVLTQINISKSFSTQVYAFMNSNATYSNMIFSSNLTTWNNPEPLFYPIYGSGIVDQTYLGSYSIGLSRQTTTLLYGLPLYGEQYLTEYFFGTRTYPTGGIYSLLSIYIQFAGIRQSQTLTFASSNLPTTLRAMASDGYRYVVTGTFAPGEYNSWFFGSAEAMSSEPYSPAVNFSPVYTGVLFSPVSGRSNGGYSMVYGGLRAPIWMVVGCGSDSSAYTSPDGLNWSAITPGYDEMRSVISLDLPEVDTPIFLTTGGTISGSNIVNGGVLQTNDLGTTWSTISATLFTGSGIALATNGSQIVVGGEDTGGNTLYSCSIRNGSLSDWSVCTGDLFSQRTNAIVWTGSNWVAGGNSGIRQSYDGITWFNPTTLTNEIFGLGYTSNAATSATIGTSFSNMLNFQDSPDLQCQRLFSAATISYYSNSIMNLNNACILDEAHNIVVPGVVTKASPLAGTSFTSTFYAVDAYISSFVSTNKLAVGTYYAGVQSV